MEYDIIIKLEIGGFMSRLKRILILIVILLLILLILRGLLIMGV